MEWIQDILTRTWTDIVARPDGPLALRFYLQPTVAKAVGKVMVFAVVLDLVCQWKVLGKFYPGEALIVAFLLA